MKQQRTAKTHSVRKTRTGNETSITLTIDGVTVTGRAEDVQRFVPALCRAIMRDTKTDA